MKKALTVLFLFTCCAMCAQDSIPHDVMQRIYDEARTPYKYGLVVAPTDNYHKFDCPTVFREGDRWLMTYVCYDGKDGTDGRGYETWLAESDDLLHWRTLGRIIALPNQPSQSPQSPQSPQKPQSPQSSQKPQSAQPLWDQNQRGGFPALIDWTWGGSYEMQRYKGRHWMTYIGGPGTGYEAVNAPLSIGLASTKGDIATAHQWDTQKRPILSYADKDAQWWEQLTQYKSTIYSLTPGSSNKGASSDNVTTPLPLSGGAGDFIMFYNAGGINPANGLKAERIGIALSNDLKHWKRYADNPVYFHEAPGIITGDAQIVRMSLSTPLSIGRGAGGEAFFVMFYFSAYNPARKYNAYNTFAVSRDLLHWQDWDGPDLIFPTKPYDEMFAHKSYVMKHDGVVYHFYCAVNNAGQRGIAVATSLPMGRSAVRFPEPEPSGRRREQSLNDGWEVKIMNSSQTSHAAKPSDLPHNLDDYYGYRQLRHGNLHGSATYEKTFPATKREGKRYFLQFEGVGTYATVTLNGHAYPRELVGRTVWTLDVSDALRDGDNHLEVLVDHPAMQTESPWVCGGCSSEWGFSEGSQPFGIFRPVTLVETDAVRIEPFGVHVWANAACDTVYIDTEIKNYTAEPQTVELVNKLALKSGKQVFRLAEPVTLQPGETRTVRQLSPIADGHHWSPADPYLHTLTTMLKRDGKTTDDLRTPFGLRSLRWPAVVGHASERASADADATLGDVTHYGADADATLGGVTHYGADATLGGVAHYDNRFRLNGEPFFIEGTCEYEHLLGASHAFSPEQIAARIKMVRNAGFNALREAHQPHNLRYQQLCDEQGLLFWSQFSAHIWYDTPQFRDNFKRLLVRWIKERRNSPSVILWGLQNESILPRDFARECCDIIRSLDPTASSQRLITTCNGGEGTDWNVIQNWSGTYGGSPDNYAEELSRPDQLLNGEYGAWRTLDLHGPAKYSEESFTALLMKKDSLARKAFCTDTLGSVSHYTGMLGGVTHYNDTLGSVSHYNDTLGSVPHYGVCGHFQWLLCSHDNPGRTQPDGALRRIDKVGPINYKGLLTTWEEPTLAYHAYAAALSPSSAAPSSASSVPGDFAAAPDAAAPSPTPADRNRDLVKAAPAYRYLWRINCGGDAYTDEYGQQWQADDSILSHSWGHDFDGIHPFQASQRHITADIRGTRSDELFQFFRFGRHRLWYDLPVNDALYRIELYFAEPWHSKDNPREDADYEGLRIFDVAVNDSTVIDDLDPWAEAGYCGALKRVVYAPAKDGRLRISFPETKAGQAIIAAIAIAQQSQSPQLPQSPHQPQSPLFWHSLDTDTIAKLPKELLPIDSDPRPATVYEPQSPQASHKPRQQKPSVTTFTVTPGLGQEYALRFRYKNTTGSTVQGRLTLTDSKGIMLVDREITFPPTPDKFKMLSTTTGTQINAGTYLLKVDADGVEFKNLEMQ